MKDETADPSIEMMAPELNRAESPLEATHPLPAASTAGISVTETIPPKEPPTAALTSTRSRAEGPMANSDSRPAAETSAATTHRREMASPEAFKPQDHTMAMENNPVTTAGKDVLGAHNNAMDQEARKPSTTPESSAIGRMVPTPAVTASRINFDGS